MHQQSPGADRLGSGSAAKALGVLVGKLTVSQQCVLLQQRQPTDSWAELGRALPAGVILPLYIIPVRPHLGTVSSFDLPIARKT